MPCFRIVTNVDVEKTVQIAFLKDVSAMLAKQLRKPEESFMSLAVPGDTVPSA